MKKVVMLALFIVGVLLLGCKAEDESYSVKITITTEDSHDFNCLWVKGNDNTVLSKAGCDWDGFDACEEIPTGEECLGSNYYEYETTLNPGDKIISRANTMSWTAGEDDYLEIKLYVDGNEVISDRDEEEGGTLSVLISYTL